MTDTLEHRHLLNTHYRMLDLLDPAQLQMDFVIEK